ncbi:MAG: flavin reductase family protein, partial [Pseudomonadota bacterium]
MNAMARHSDMVFAPDPENTRQLRDAFGKFATGVTVVTCAGADGPLCITANSFSSISLDPALVMWAPGKSSRRFPLFRDAEHYAIHVLAAEQ